MTESSSNEIKKGPEAGMSEEAPMYIYATEMVSDYYSLLDVEGKSVLSITGSGDQVLNPVLMGAKNVVGFDLNKRAWMITELKMAAIKSVTYEEFLDFFGSETSRPSFQYEIYKKIDENLPEKAQTFFRRIYAEFSNDGVILAESEYFRQRYEVIENNLKKINLYLKNSDMYEKTRSLLSGFSLDFIVSDLQNIPLSRDLDNAHFDLINLSNVPNYLVENKDHTPYVSKMDFIEILLNLGEKLNQGGKIFFYSYSLDAYPNKIAEKPPVASREETHNELRSLDNYRFDQMRFTGTNGESDDVINILEKL